MTFSKKNENKKLIDYDNKMLKKQRANSYLAMDEPYNSSI